VDYCNSTYVETVKLADFIYIYILLRRRFVPETFCYRRRSVTEAFCFGDVLYGDVLSRRRFVCAPFVGAYLLYELQNALNMKILKYIESAKTAA
jgi:hypothetical protein